jgi:hypothetical protein
VFDHSKPQPDSSVIVFRFAGGARDGEAIRTDQPTVTREVANLWETTWKGTIGRRFDVSTPNGFAFHRYQVKGKYEVDGEIHVMCEHVD